MIASIAISHLPDSVRSFSQQALFYGEFSLHYASAHPYKALLLQLSINSSEAYPWPGKENQDMESLG